MGKSWVGLTIEDDVPSHHGWCGREFDGFCSNEIDETDGRCQALGTGRGDREAAALSEPSGSLGSSAVVLVPSGRDDNRVDGRRCASLEQSGLASKVEDASDGWKHPEAPESPKGVLWRQRGYRVQSTG